MHRSNRHPGIAATLTVLSLMGGLALSATAHAQNSRNPWTQPFSNDSIWNIPIGLNAVYVPANLGTLGKLVDDHEYLFVQKPTDPLRRMYQANGSGYSVTLNIPDGFIPDPDGPYYTPNNPSAWVNTDGKTLLNLSPIQRKDSSGNPSGYSDMTGYWYTDSGGNLNTDLYGQGIGGAHFGSLMSCLGGSIRRGELTDNNVNNRIKHAIKLELDWDDLYQNQGNTANRNQTYRWPATTSDGGALGNTGYRGTNAALKMGSLLAIPQKDSNGNPITETSLGLQTVPGKKLFHVLQDYGGYVVDTSGNAYYPNGYHAFNICFESTVAGDFQGSYGYALETNPGNNWYSDVNKLYGKLAVVDNNSPTTIGGGGSPAVTPAAPLNQAVNPSFEYDGVGNQNVLGWTRYSANGSGDYNAAYTENLGTAHGGSYQMTFYRATPYFIQEYQLRSVPNGNYVLKAWVESSGGFSESFMYAYRYADVNGGTTLTANIPTTGGGAGDWQQLSIPVTVTAGQVEIGFRGNDPVGGHYLRADDVELYPVLINRATGGTASASSNPVAAEAAAKAFDSNTGTKWLGTTTSGNPVAWLQYQFGSSAAYAVKQYKITSANDTPTRDPKSWSLCGSNDGSTWVTLDTQTNQSFSGRFITNTYTIANTTSYKYYRLKITANNGSTETSLGGTGMVQLAELQLLD